MKKIFLLFSILIRSDSIYPQSDKYFIKFFGEDTIYEDPFKIFQLPDQGYIILGDKYTFGYTFYYSTLKKINKKGDLIWEKQYGLEDWKIYPRDIFITTNSYYIVGTFHNRTSGIYYTGVQKTDTSGNLLWYKIVGDSTIDGGTDCIKPTYNGNFILVGTLFRSDTLRYQDALTLKIDSSGNLLEKKTYGQFGNNDFFNWVEQTSDSGFIFVGTWGFLVDEGEIWIMKADKNGNKLWDRKYSNYDRAIGSFINTTSDKGFIVSGVVETVFLRYNGYLVKLDSIGNPEWEYLFYNNENDTTLMQYSSSFNIVEQLKDGSFIAAGGVEINRGIGLYEDYDMLLVKVSSDGKEIWRRNFGNMKGEDESVWCFSITDDGGFILGGRSHITPDSGSNIIYSDDMVIKTNCAGFIGPPLAFMSINIVGDTVLLTDTSANADSIMIDFGDGTSPFLYQAWGKNSSWVQSFYSKWKSYKHGYTNSGNYNVTLIASACGEYDTLVQQITILPTTTKPIELIKPEFEVKVIPNPFSDFITIEYPASESILFELYDLTGRKKITTKLNHPFVRTQTDAVRSSATHQVSTLNLPQGVYIYRITNENRSVKHGKMVKQ